MDEPTVIVHLTTDRPDPEAVRRFLETCRALRSNLGLDLEQHEYANLFAYALTSNEQTVKLIEASVAVVQALVSACGLEVLGPDADDDELNRFSTRALEAVEQIMTSRPEGA